MFDVRSVFKSSYQSIQTSSRLANITRYPKTIEMSMDQLNAALISIKVLRSSVGQVFESLGNGIRAEHGEEGRETKFLLELQELLNSVNVNLRLVIQKTIFRINI